MEGSVNQAKGLNKHSVPAFGISQFSTFQKPLDTNSKIIIVRCPALLISGSVWTGSPSSCLGLSGLVAQHVRQSTHAAKVWGLTPFGAIHTKTVLKML